MSSSSSGSNHLGKMCECAQVSFTEQILPIQLRLHECNMKLSLIGKSHNFVMATSVKGTVQHFVARGFQYLSEAKLMAGLFLMSDCSRAAVFHTVTPSGSNQTSLLINGQV